MDTFYDKNAMEKFMREKMPVYIVTSDSLGLDGAIEYGKRMVQGTIVENTLMNMGMG